MRQLPTRSIVTVSIFLLFALTLSTGAALSLEIEKSENGPSILTQNGEPLFAFGPMNELMPWAVKLGSKTFDVERWAAWQKDNGMNYIRGYPESGWGWCPLDAEGRLFPFQTASTEPLKFDISVWNEPYWDNFREVTACLARNGVVVHLQLYQQCYFEDNSPERWKTNYWNPANNVNRFTKALSPNSLGHHPFIEAGVAGNQDLLAHQSAYLEHVLNAVAGLGNVFLDLSNEMGDGGLEPAIVKKWIDHTLGVISAWERKTGEDILVGMDYTHLPRELAQYVLSHPQIELIITHGDFVWPEGLVLHRLYGKPVVLVNSRDKSPESYMSFGRSGDDTRLRRFHWRALLSGCQGVGDYSQRWKVDPRGFDKTEDYARHLRSFVSSIQNYMALHSTLRNHTIYKKVIDGPGFNRYILESANEAIIYIEGEVHLSEVTFSGRPITVFNSHMSEGPAEAEIFHPATGESEKQKVQVRGGTIEGIVLPSFTDDIAIHIRRETLP